MNHHFFWKATQDVLELIGLQGLTSSYSLNLAFWFALICLPVGGSTIGDTNSYEAGVHIWLLCSSSLSAPLDIAQFAAVASWITLRNSETHGLHVNGWTNGACKESAVGIYDMFLMKDVASSSCDELVEKKGLHSTPVVWHWQSGKKNGHVCSFSSGASASGGRNAYGFYLPTLAFWLQSKRIN